MRSARNHSVVRVRIMSERIYLHLLNPPDAIQDREGVEIFDIPRAKAAVAAIVDELRHAATAQD
jgi:hypothetical protein